MLLKTVKEMLYSELTVSLSLALFDSPPVREDKMYGFNICVCECLERGEGAGRGSKH